MERVENYNIRAGGVVHAPGFAQRGIVSLLACRGRVAAHNIENAGVEMVSCFWCLAGLIDPELRWFKWGDEK